MNEQILSSISHGKLCSRILKCVHVFAQPIWLICFDVGANKMAWKNERNEWKISNNEIKCKQNWRIHMLNNNSSGHANKVRLEFIDIDLQTNKWVAIRFRLVWCLFGCHCRNICREWENDKQHTSTHTETMYKHFDHFLQEAHVTRLHNRVAHLKSGFGCLNVCGHTFWIIPFNWAVDFPLFHNSHQNRIKFWSKLFCVRRVLSFFFPLVGKIENLLKSKHLHPKIFRFYNTQNVNLLSKRNSTETQKVCH